MRIMYMALLLATLQIGVAHSMEKMPKLIELQKTYNQLEKYVVTSASKEAFEQQCKDLKTQATINNDFSLVKKVQSLSTCKLAKFEQQSKINELPLNLQADQEQIQKVSKQLFLSQHE